MKKTNRIKLGLDLLMLIIVLLMYRKNVLGLAFHELGGIALCALYILHILLNGKWVRAVSPRLFSKKTAFRCKLNWILDFLLLLCFAYILISGILISKILFHGLHGASVFKTGHFAVSALALVLIGIHLGLHYQSIRNRIAARKASLQLRRTAAAGLSLLILGIGIYEITATQFLDWMAKLGAVAGITEPSAANDPAKLYAAGQHDGQEIAQPDAALETQPRESGHGSGRGNGGSGKGLGNGSNDTQPDPAALADVFLGFLSITLTFAVLTAWIDGIQRISQRNKRLRCTVPA